ncbi:hypothetical protein AB0933_15645 [Streptomyces venezuelae]|uniref:hypothetical protein n=1 Tax=Streptomyces venezuelae TaxID=54571 RepID=UPI00345459BF
MSWTPLLATLLGAVIATGSALLVEFRKDRRETTAEQRRSKRELYGAYLGALAAARSELNLIFLNRGMPEAERRSAARRCFAQCYDTRYQIEIFAPRAVVEPALAYFLSVRRAREAAIRGVAPGDPEHDLIFEEVMDALSAVSAAMRLDMRTDKLPSA